MKKIGPLIVIFNGIFTVLISILGILVARNVFELPKFLTDFAHDTTTFSKEVKLTANVIYIISIVIGLAEILLGWRAIKHPKGFMAFILIAIFMVSIGLTVWNGAQAKRWPVATIITLSINGVALLSLLIGFFSVKK